MKPFLSVVLAVSGRERATIPLTLIDLDAALSKEEYSYEIVLVERYKEEEEWKPYVLPPIQNIISCLRIVQCDEKGKARSWWKGLESARGNWRVCVERSAVHSVHAWSLLFQTHHERPDLFVILPEGNVWSMFLRVPFLKMCIASRSGVLGMSESTIPSLRDFSYVKGEAFFWEILKIAEKLKYKIGEVKTSSFAPTISFLFFLDMILTWWKMNRKNV